jgi:hypothetical protein
MSYTARAARLDDDQEEICTILCRNLPNIDHRRRFVWLYLQNPAGVAWSWFAIDEATRIPIGAASLFPRAMWVDQEVVTCGQVGDFAIDMNYRTLGPALTLQRATFEPVDAGILAFCYDCPPHGKGMSTFRRLKMDPTTSVSRHVRIVRTKRLFRTKLGNHLISNLLGMIGDLALHLIYSSRQYAQGYQVAAMDGLFAEEFDELDQRVGGRFGVRSRRLAVDLNWRFRRDPLNQYRVLTAHQNGALEGYLIFSVTNEDCFLIDIFGILTLAMVRSLAEVLLHKIRSEAVQTVHFAVSDENSVGELLPKVSFRRREQVSQVVIYAKGALKWTARRSESQKLAFTHADVLA